MSKKGATMEGKKPLIEKFIRKHRLDSDTDSEQVLGWLQGASELAREQRMQLVLCKPAEDCYCFQDASLPELDYLAHKSISVKQLKQLVHYNDRDHFTNACRLGIKYFAKLPPEEAGNLALLFECRVRGKKDQYHNLQFKYRILGTNQPWQQPALVLMMVVVERKETCIPPQGIYVVDFVKRCIVKSFGHKRLTNHEISKYRHLKMGLNLSEAASKACVSYSSIKRHRQSIFDKTATSSDSQVAPILTFMGIN
jgi:DNA-binding CsgD family transcriptional regulator